MLEGGITLQDGTTLKEAKIKVVEQGENPLVKIMICEGKYHQVKRMFKVLGNEVIFLKRIAIGSLKLDENLAPGEYRELSNDEINEIFSF